MTKLIVTLNLLALSFLAYAGAAAYLVTKPVEIPKQVSKKETRVKIVVIDNGWQISEKIKPFVCDIPSISPSGDSPIIKDRSHGTVVSELIVDQLDSKQFCLVMVKFTTNNLAVTVSDNIVAGIRYAIQIKAKFINMSLSGTEGNADELKALKDAIAKGIHIAVASGNSDGFGPEKDAKGEFVDKKDINGKKILKRDKSGKPYCTARNGEVSCLYEKVETKMGKNLDEKCDVYPACYNLPVAYFHVVGSSTGYFNSWGGIHYYGNYGKAVKFEEDGTSKGNPPMTGTSMSTAIHLGKWAAGKVK